MSNRPITVEWLRERCEIETDDNGCEHWVWKLGTLRGEPRGNLDGQFMVRREIFQLTRGYLQRKRVVKAKCVHELCVHPDCLVQIARNQDKVGRPRPVHVRAKIAKSNRGKTELTRDDAAEILEIGLQAPAYFVAPFYGASEFQVHGIRQYRRWRDISNPFSALWGTA